MKRYLSLLIAILLVGSTLNAQLVMDVIITNEVDNAGVYEFDVLFRQSAGSTGPIYFHNGDLIVNFNPASFANPVVSKVEGTPCNLFDVLFYQHGHNNFLSTTFNTPDNNCQAESNVQKIYYDKSNVTSDFVGDGEAVINFDPINVGDQGAFEDQIAKIDGSVYVFGRFGISGYIPDSTAGLSVKLPAPGPPPAPNGDVQLSPLVSKAFSIDPATFNSDPVVLVQDVLLPVRLIDFAANKYNRSSSMLVWQTVTEQNASHFMIERSERGTEEAWETVGKVDAAGNSTNVETYEFIDRGAYNGLRARVEFLYRLKIVDNDDSFEYSNIEAVTFTSDGSGSGDVTVFPNPVKDVLHVQIAGNMVERPTDIVIYDVLGKRVYSKQIGDDADYTYINMYEAGMEAGTYLVQFVNNDMMISQEQIIVQR